MIPRSTMEYEKSNTYTTTQKLLRGVFKWGSEAGGLVARLGYSRQAAVAEPPKKSGPRAPIDVSTDLR